MDKARFYSPYLNRFVQPDTLIPSPANPQAFNRYSYVMNSPVNFNDPTGHMCSDPEDPTPSCDGSTPPFTPSVPNNGGGGGGNSDEDEGDLEDELGQDDCTYHLCSDANLYEIGWENFGQAWGIWTNPNATYGQQFAAGAYMSFWGGAHICLILCSAVAAVEIMFPGAVSCAMMLHCLGAVFYTGGKVAYEEATNFANATGRYTLNMTVPGRILDSMDRYKLFSNKTMDLLWEFASNRFAHGASGVVNSFINASAYNPLRTYGRVEFPILNNNPHVLQIIHTVLIP